jgi:hypothetical protein
MFYGLVSVERIDQLGGLLQDGLRSRIGEIVVPPPTRVKGFWGRLSGKPALGNANTSVHRATVSLTLAELLSSSLQRRPELDRALHAALPRDALLAVSPPDRVRLDGLRHLAARLDDLEALMR